MWYYIQVHKKRGVAQLGERVVWDHEVARSIRVTPTRFRDFLRSLFFIIKKLGKCIALS